MTQPFDTGLARSQRELVQDAIIAMLQPFATTSPGGFLAAIEPIAFEVNGQDNESLDALQNVLQGRAPAVAVAALSLKSAQAGGPGRSLGELDVVLYVVSTNQRGQVTGRARMDAAAIANNAADPGIFAILELVWSRLFDMVPAPATTALLKRVGEEPVAVTPEQTIFAQHWRVQLTCDANLVRDITQKFTNAVSKLHLQPDKAAKSEIDETTTVG